MWKERGRLGGAALAVLIGIGLSNLSACDSQSDRGAQGSEEPGTASNKAESASIGAASTQAIEPNGLNAAEQEAIKRGLMEILQSRTFGKALTRDRFSCAEVFAYGEAQVTDASLSGQAGMVQLTVPVTGHTPAQNEPNVRPPTFFPGRECFGLQDYAEWSPIPGQPVPLRFEIVVQRWQTGWRLMRNQNPRALL
jgi:hypothetical protein